MTGGDWMNIAFGIMLAMLVFTVEMILVVLAQTIIDSSEEEIEKKKNERLNNKTL